MRKSPNGLTKKSSTRDLSSMELSEIPTKMLEQKKDSFKNYDTRVVERNEKYDKYAYFVVIGCIIYGASFFL